MSPNINSFVGDLVEMARAMEELPGIKAKLDEAYDLLEEERKTVQDRELRIQQLKADSDIMQERINNLEVARDDAELRFLEADERTERALDFIKTQFGAAGGLIQSLEPPKSQEPVVQAQPVEAKPEPGESVSPSPSEGSSATEPLGDSYSQSSASVSLTGDPSNVDSWASGPGQSEAGKSDTLPDATSTNDHLQSAGSDHVEQPAIANAEPKSGRYSGRRYYDWATYVPLHQWLAEGGTEEDYNWRPVRLPMHGQAD